MSNAEKSKYISVQVQTVICNGGGVHVVTMNDKKATDWALYGRLPDGSVEWLQDIPIHEVNPAKYFTQAMVAAAQVSMEHFIPIEPVQ